MKDTPEVREELRNRVARGVESLSALKALDGKFVSLREMYRSQLVSTVRNKAGNEEIVLGAVRIAALEDLYEDFYQDVVSGRKAEKMETQLEEAKDG